MKKAQNPRRSRPRAQKRGSGHKNGNSSNRSGSQFRGNPKQQIDKYKALAREAQQSGDRVQVENWLQHADHYQRILNERMPPVVEEALDEADATDEDDHNEQPSSRPSRSRRARDRSEEEETARQQSEGLNGTAIATNGEDVTEVPQPTENRDQRELVGVEVTPPSDEEEAPKPRKRRGRPPRKDAEQSTAVESGDAQISAPGDDAAA